MAVRQRQTSKRGEHVGPSPRRMAESSRSSTPLLRRRYSKKMYIVTFAFLVSLFILYFGSKSVNRLVDGMVVGLNLHKPFYVVVIDAGSTASRVLAFGFHANLMDGQVILDTELFHQESPGLANFAKNPQKVEPYLQTLLDKARSVIPPEERSKTPLTLKATAGLRLLPGHEANDLLDECGRVFNNSGFLVQNPGSVSIMDASDEGIFSWFTVNYLLNNFINIETDTVGVFDLGGGSTQVTFKLGGEKARKHRQYLYSINVFGKNVSLYTRSILGMGLMAARKEILLHPDNALKEPVDTEEGEEEEVGDDAIRIRTECVNPIIKGVEWHYGGKKYLVRGPTNGTHKIIKSKLISGVDDDAPVVRFQDCKAIIKKVVRAAIPEKFPSLDGHEVYTISYYFDRAAEAGLIDPFKGGVITVQSFYEAAQNTCDYPNTEQPFMCLDLTFIYVLLNDGFGLARTTQLSLKKKINGHETSWALGAGFSLLQTEV